MLNTVLHGDCLELMKDIPDGSVDMVLADLPYGTTRNRWDSIIPLDLLWNQYKRIIKDDGAIVLTAQTPFDKILGVSNLNMLRYEWIWHKNKATGHLNAKKMPLKAHENILVFYKKAPTYNPVMGKGKPYSNNHRPGDSGTNYGKVGFSKRENVTTRYPRSVLDFNIDAKPTHPTQKPVALFEYLIKTYTNEGDTVLDNCAGSGTTGIASINTNRNYILMEQEQEYIDVINKRIAEHVQTVSIL